jgi:hypothetical protein
MKNEVCFVHHPFLLFEQHFALDLSDLRRKNSVVLGRKTVFSHLVCFV